MTEAAISVMYDMEIAAEGVERVRSELGALLSRSSMLRLNREIGINVREHTADHIARASVTRHKVADRLGAKHTKFLEFAPARGQLRGGSKFDAPDGKQPFTEVRDISDDGVLVVIGNTPGLRRAFGAITIKPRKAKALTIPLHKIAYAKRVADLRSEGHEIFRPKGTNILAEEVSKGRGKRKKTEFRPLYALVKSTTLPQDRGLLPSDANLKTWTRDTTEQFIDAMLDELMNSK